MSKTRKSLDQHDATARDRDEYLPPDADTNQQRQQGRKAQISNIQAAKTIADIIRSSLGPRTVVLI